MLSMKLALDVSMANDAKTMTADELDMWHAKFHAASMERMMRSLLPRDERELPRQAAKKEAA